ncbi:MAG TPA: molybdopterin-dependent oxidoreductase, partial [Acidobacteriota bacterium]|nr:molybdopterin-dependent oxidoreductase [Acidobacteriota bacterium]
LGPLIHHEMNRCIQCYRCVNFYTDHTGGQDLGVFASRDRVYFGRVEEGALESPFSGNLAEVCPTGVFTDKTYRRHYTRKWDLQSAPSICNHCGLGCNTLVSAREGSLRRVTSRYNSEVNGYWLCDRGRFGYQYVNANDRTLKPQTPQRKGDDLNISAARIWNEASSAVREAAAAGKLAAIGSPRASLESNFALQTLAGKENFCSGIAEPEYQLVARFADAACAGIFHVPTLQEIEKSDAIMVLGADLTNEAPLLDLAIFRAHAITGAPIHVISLRPGRVSEFATSFESGDPSSIATRGRAIAASLSTDDCKDPVASALAAAERPLVITSTQHRDAEILEVSLEVLEALQARNGTQPWFAMSVSEANTLGVTLLNDRQGMGVTSVIHAIETGEVSALIVVENDLFERYEDHRHLADSLKRLDVLVVLDHMVTATSSLGTHTFPAATVPESNGTLINSEGRIQRFYQVLRPAEEVVPSWNTVGNIIAAIGQEKEGRWQHFEEVTAAIETSHPLFSGMMKVAPPAGFRLNHQSIPRMSQRFSGRNAAIKPDARNEPDRGKDLCHDGELPVAQQTADDPETPFAFSMEGFTGRKPPELLSQVWAPGWNSNEAINQFQIEVGGPLHGGDPGLRIFDSNSSGLNENQFINAAIGSLPVTEAREKDDTVLVCAAVEIFGSESMSRRSPALAELAPDIYLRLHSKDAGRLSLVDGCAYRVQLISETFETSLNVVIDIDNTIPDNVTVIPAGYAETRWWQQPRWMRLKSVKVEP